MFSLNQVVLAGTANKVQQRMTQDGKAVVSGLIYVKSVTRTGKEYTDHISFSAFGQAAQELQTVKDGDGIIIVGQLKHRSYQDRNGQTVYKDEVWAFNAEHVPSPAVAFNNVDDRVAQYQQTAPQYEQQTIYQQQNTFNAGPDDLPF